ncbi:MAG: transposase zinc-binding domain-containing protein [Lewinellaceae bacterium]|nr:transposase zinc-binding domain-containing protein [Lewinellaceae bacterium]
MCKHHLRTLSALERCRTAALGGHIDACTECGAVRISYNSCRNRHCPKCGGMRANYGYRYALKNSSR